MSAISMGLNNIVAVPSTLQIFLIVTGLTDGLAQPGDLLALRLSNGVTILDQIWGSSHGASDYGTQPTLMVPAEAAGGVLHVTANTDKDQFTALIGITLIAPAETDIRPGPEAIVIESLAARLEPTLKLSTGVDAIIVEID